MLEPIELEHEPPFMARISFGLLLVLAALIQATVLPRINPFMIAPDLVLVFLFVWSASRSIRESLFWVFFTGLLLDILGLDYFGTNALALVVVVLTAGLVRQRVLHANIVAPVVLMMVATVIHGVVLGALRGTIDPGLHLLIQAAIHAALIPVIYLVLRVFDR
jgi:rod shape-determining protein MreD